MNDSKLQLKIFSPVEDIFDGEILSLSSENSAGPFDILPEHADFITLIDKKTINFVLSDGKKGSFKFDQAVLRCHQGKIEVFADLSKAEEVLPETSAFNKKIPTLM